MVFPDPLGEDRNMYGYGFRDASRWQRILQTVDPNSAAGREAHDAIYSWKGDTQNASPLLWMNEGENVQIVLYNLGWQVRPDIPDGHTIHWHGFRNAIPWFDGVPEMAAGAPIGKTLTYFYNPVDAGTYMYHCHWEDVEHIQMGMTGIVFVNPKQNTTGVSGTPVSFYTPSRREVRLQRPQRRVGVRPAVRVHADGLQPHPALAARAHPAAGLVGLPAVGLGDERAYVPGHGAAEGRDRGRSRGPAALHGHGTGGNARPRPTGVSGVPAGVTAGKIVTLVSGPGAGQRREIASRCRLTITVAEPWDTYLGLPTTPRTSGCTTSRTRSSARSRSRRWSPATRATGCCCASRTSATSSTR